MLYLHPVMMLVVTVAVLSSLMVGGARAGCAEGWQLAGDSCYRVSAGEVDWYEAQQVSRGWDAELIILI